MALESNKNSLENLWFVGVILATLASFVSNLGLNLQKLLHLRNEGKPVEIRDNYYKFGLWWLGLSLIVVGALADFAALTFAPQSLVAPLGSLTLVSNIILSPIILKEIITSWDIFATLTIVCGCIISVAFASHDDVVYSNNELFDFFIRWPFLIYISLVIIFMTMCFIAMKHYEKIEHDSQRYSSKEESWHRLTYPAISGTVGAQSVLFAKCFIEMLVNTFEGRGAFYLRWPAYFIIMAMTVCIVLQVKWLNDGLIRFDAAFEVPVFQAFWVVLSVASGLVFYNEYRGMNDLQKGLFAFGIVVTVTGVIMLSRGRRVHRPSGHTDSDDEADAMDSQTRIISGDGRSNDDTSSDEETGASSSSSSSSSSSYSRRTGARGGQRDRFSDRDEESDSLSDGETPHDPAYGWSAPRNQTKGGRVRGGTRGKVELGDNSQSDDEGVPISSAPSG